MGQPGEIKVKVQTPRGLSGGMQLGFRGTAQVNLRPNLEFIANRFKINSPNLLEAKFSSLATSLLGKIRSNIPLTAVDISAYETLLTDFNRRPNQEKQLKGLLDCVLIDLKGSAQISIGSEGTIALSSPANDNSSPALAILEAGVKGEILGSQGLNINFELSLGQLVKTAAEQNVPLEELIGNLTASVKFETSSPALAMFGRLAVSLALDEIAQSIPGQISQAAQLSPEALKSLANAAVKIMAKILGKTNTAVEVEPSQNKEGKPVLTVKVASRPKESEAINASAKMISSRLWESTPLLAKAAAAAVKENPANIAEVAQFTAAVIKELEPRAAVAVTREIVKAVADFPEMITQLLAEAPAAGLPALIIEHSQVQADHLPLKETIGTALQEFAKTETGQAQVLQLFAEGKQEILTSNPIGQAVVVQTLRAVLNNARNATEPAKLELTNVSDQTQLLQVARLVADANHIKLTQMAFTVEQSISALEFIAQSQQLLKPVLTQEPAISQQPAVAQDEVIPQELVIFQGQALPQMAAAPSVKAPATPTAATQQITVPIQQMVDQLIDHAAALGLTIPRQFLPVIGSQIAAAAGLINPNVKEGLPASAKDLPAYQESANTSAMRAVVNALEAQATKPLLAATGGQLISTNASAIAAELLIYGLILKRVKGDLEETLEIIAALKERDLLKKLISAIEHVEDHKGHKQNKGKKQRKNNQILTVKKDEFDVDDIDDFINEVATATRFQDGNVNIVALINRLIELKGQLTIEIPLAA